MLSAKIARPWQLVALSLIAVSGSPSHAQVVAHGEQYDFTLEGYVNATGAVRGEALRTDSAAGDVKVDGALRGLLRWKNRSGPDVGLRVVVESSPQDRLELTEASILLLGKGGRLELGRRQGLPDVLVGYAPNNFAFTGAEFGPASGPSLDPGGGLAQSLLPRRLSMPIDELSVLGSSAALFADRSAKVVYVSPKRRGFLIGASYAPDAEDTRFRELVQVGVVHERYWDSNVLRLGGSLSVAQPQNAEANSRGALRSLNLGATLVLDYDWMLGISATLNDMGRPAGVDGGLRSTASGLTASANYNRGRWTTGAYVQWAQSDGDAATGGQDRLRAAEAGASYRLSTKLRLYGACYLFRLDAGGSAARISNVGGTVWLLGARATL